MINFIVRTIIYLIFIILQFVIPKYMPFDIWIIYPNFILMFILYTALNKGIMKGQITGFIYGLTWDTLSTDIFGVRALSFTIAGYLSGFFSKKLNKKQPITQITVMTVGLVITKLLLAIIHVITPSTDDIFIQNFELSYSVLANIAVNLILTPIMFKIFLFIEERICRRQI